MLYPNEVRSACKQSARLPQKGPFSQRCDGARGRKASRWFRISIAVDESLTKRLRSLCSGVGAWICGCQLVVRIGPWASDEWESPSLARSVLLDDLAGPLWAQSRHLSDLVRCWLCRRKLPEGIIQGGQFCRRGEPVLNAPLSTSSTASSGSPSIFAASRSIHAPDEDFATSSLLRQISRAQILRSSGRRPSTEPLRPLRLAMARHGGDT